MRLSLLATFLGTFAAAAGLSVLAAGFAVGLIEDSSEIAVREALDVNEMHWAEVQADGLEVKLSGTAPDEATRFEALTVTGGVVDTARVIDQIEVKSAEAIAPPRFSAEILRNDAGISVIGLIPSSTDRERALQRLSRLTSEAEVTDLVETADYPAPEGWEQAFSYALDATQQLARAQISVSADQVAISAIADSETERDRLLRGLNRSAPAGLPIQLNIAAPRPVITPFIMRFVKDDQGARFDTCSADSEDSSRAILDAGSTAGVTSPAECLIGMGVPTRRWVDAVTMAIAAVDELGGGSVTFSNADISLVALEGTDQGVFDRVVGDLEVNLPPVFSLTSQLPQPVDNEEGPPEFVATLSPEGLVQLRGRVNDANLRRLTESYAQAAFGSDRVYMGARVVDDLPADWPVRALASIDALSLLGRGVVTATPDKMAISGETGVEDARNRISSLFVEKLGETVEIEIDVTYREELDPEVALPTPEECEAQIVAIQAETKISFEPGSATVAASAAGPLDQIAEVLKSCRDIRLEVQGYTDSQGREEMNLSLSQARAQSVLSELRARRVLTSRFTAKGYGEASPIADNDTQEGREANRRIEFKVLRAEASVPSADVTGELTASEAPAESE